MCQGKQHAVLKTEMGKGFGRGPRECSLRLRSGASGKGMAACRAVYRLPLTILLEFQSPISVTMCGRNDVQTLWVISRKSLRRKFVHRLLVLPLPSRRTCSAFSRTNPNYFQTMFGTAFRAIVIFQGLIRIFRERSTVTASLGYEDFNRLGRRSRVIWMEESQTYSRTLHPPKLHFKLRFRSTKSFANIHGIPGVCACLLVVAESTFGSYWMTLKINQT